MEAGEQQKDSENAVSAMRPDAEGTGKRPGGVPLISAHARQRMAQRNIHPDDLAYVLAHGRRTWSGNGCQYIFLAQKDIPGDDLAGRRAKLEGTTVVLQVTRVVTVYRNRRAGRRGRRKER